ncbi:MAG: hypothetical protein J6X28_04355 [Bacilli bacterium]|nr:hypothetical protein [Bacilli bacterium]
MNGEEQLVELEEEEIPTAQAEGNDSGLNDVIPCEPVTFSDEQMDFGVMGEYNDGFYDTMEEAATTPAVVPLDQMVDIAPHTVEGTSNELEEVDIPQEDNKPDDNQLDDVVA